MKTLVEKCDIHITTIKNALPQEKPVAGKFQISEDCTVAMFKEEENATVIIGKGKSKRIMLDNILVSRDTTGVCKDNL